MDDSEVDEESDAAEDSDAGEAIEDDHSVPEVSKRKSRGVAEVRRLV